MNPIHLATHCGSDCPSIDDDVFARAVLTFCLDGADALMVALLKGSEHAMQALEFVLLSMEDNDSATRNHALRTIDGMFITGLARWGRKATAQGMQSFHRSLQRWQGRLHDLPCDNRDDLLAWFTKEGTYWITTPSMKQWPEQLHDLALRSDWAPPLCLWGLGDVNTLCACEQPVAVVGSRAVNDYGRYVAQTLAFSCAMAGHTIVSGGAMGADAYAHWGALRAMDMLDEHSAGRTIAVFAGGLNNIGPSSNQHLFDEIVAHHGALISELSPDTIPQSRRFLLRNRIIAALSNTVFIAQARLRSGALNTARWANELNRQVYAAPGNINQPDHAGCNELISNQQAILLRNATEIASCCHEAHAPRLTTREEAQPSCDESSQRIQEHTNVQFDEILSALQACKKQGVQPTNTAVHAQRCALSDSDIAMSDTLQLLGIMEVEGYITHKGNTIMRVVNTSHM